MDRGRKTREPGSGQSLIAREDKPVTVRFVGVDGVFVQGAGTPAVVAADSVDIKVDTDIDEIPLGKFERMLRILDVFLSPGPSLEAKRLDAFYTKFLFPVGESDPSGVASVSVLLRSRIVDDKVFERHSVLSNEFRRLSVRIIL